VLASTGTDLVVPSLTTTATTLIEGDTFTADYSVTNQGTAASASTTVHYFLSTDATITPTDIYLGSLSYIPSLAGGETTVGSQTLTMPSGPAAGTYYIGAIVDYYDYVVESDETNNALVGPTLVLASTGTDLVVPSLTTTATTLIEGDTFTADYSVTNQGTAASASTTVHYFLSTDATITPTDIYLGSFSDVPSLVGGETTVGSQLLTIPSGLTVGSYYIGAIVDYFDYVIESDETNNTLAGPVLTLQ